MRAWPLLTLALLATSALALSGCVGASATVAGQGYQSGTQSRSVTCGTVGHLAYGSQGSGALHVSVTDGAGTKVYEASTGYQMGQGGQAQDIQGKAGTWTLSVDTGAGYAGQWGVTLSC